MKNKKFLGMFLSLLAVVTILVTACGTTKYSITFNTNGGSNISTMQLEEGESITVPTTTKTDMTFDTWYSDVDLTKKYTFPSVMPAEDIKVYAKWVVKLTFDSKGGSVVNPLVAAPKAAIVLPQNPTRENFTFVGWYLEATYATKLSIIMPSKNTTVYAKWQVLDEGTRLPFYNWVSNDAPAYVITTQGTATTYTATAEKGEYALVKTTINENVKDYSTVVMDVKGTKDCKILLKLEGGGAQFVEKEFTLTGEDQRITWTVTAENLTETGGETFLWFLNPGVKGASATPEYVTIKGSYLYRTVDETDTNKKVSIFFNVNGGSSVAKIEAAANAAITAPTAPTKTGFDFKGWFTDKELTTAFLFAKMPGSSLVLHAKWEKLGVALDDYSFITNDWAGLDANTCTFVIEEGILKVTKTDAREYVFAKNPADVSQLMAFNILKIEVKGTAGQQIGFNINNQKEVRATCDGTVQYFEFNFDNITLTGANPALLIFAGAGLVGPSDTFEISRLAYSNQSEQQSLLDGWVENDPGTYTIANENNGLQLAKLGSGEWMYVKKSISDMDVTGFSKLVITVKGTAGAQIMIKINDSNDHQKFITCDGTVQTLEFPLDVVIDNTKSLSIFAGPGVAAATNVFEITQLMFR